MKINGYFNTFDIYLAAILVSLGFEISKLDRTDTKRVEFCFKHNEKLDEIVQRYWDKELSLEPQALFANLKQLKNRIYST